MLNISSKTKMTPEEVIKKAIAFFGPNGYKLKIISQMDTSISFEGQGGGIDINACQQKGYSSVDFISREWDFQVKEFINTVL
jgi:hypothetical protein